MGQVDLQSLLHGRLDVVLLRGFREVPGAVVVWDGGDDGENGRTRYRFNLQSRTTSFAGVLDRECSEKLDAKKKRELDTIKTERTLWLAF